MTKNAGKKTKADILRENKQHIKEMREQGLSYDKISHKFGVSRAFLYQFINDKIYNRSGDEGLFIQCDRADCFACENGDCQALSYHNTSKKFVANCPFYKTKEQNEADRLRAERLNSQRLDSRKSAAEV